MQVYTHNSITHRPWIRKRRSKVWRMMLAMRCSSCSHRSSRSLTSLAKSPSCPSSSKPWLKEVIIFLHAASSLVASFAALVVSTCKMKRVLLHTQIADSEEMVIPLPNVKADVLRKVVQYMKYHTDNPSKEIEKPLKSANMSEVVSQWDADFVDVDQELLFELILAANYMDIKPLLDLTCAKVASMIKGTRLESFISPPFLVVPYSACISGGPFYRFPSCL